MPLTHYPPLPSWNQQTPQARLTHTPPSVTPPSRPKIEETRTPHRPPETTPPPSKTTGAGGTTTDPILTDPVYQQTLEAEKAADITSEASALARRKELLLQYGDPSLTMSTIGDQDIATAAAKNPYSTLALLAKGYSEAQRTTDQAANQANLFYSGARVKQLGENAYTYGQNQYTAQNALASALQKVTTDLLREKESHADVVRQAYTDAYNRALKNATT